MPKKGTKYRELRSRIAYLGMSQDQVDEAAGYGRQFISCRITGKTPWRLEEVYAVCRVLEIDYKDIPVYFPPEENAKLEKTPATTRSKRPARRQKALDYRVEGRVTV